MPARPRDNRAVYARRKARAQAAGTTVYKRRQERARAEGWKNTQQKTYWRHQLTDQRVRELAEQIGGPVEPEREGSLMSREANRIINPPGEPRVGDWRVRLLKAAGEL